MHSIRAKTTLLTAVAIIASMLASTILGAVAIRDLGVQSSDQILYLLCETGVKNLNAYFLSVEQSVETVSSYADEDIQKTELSNLDEHISRVRDVFGKTANNTAGVLTYYYRIDPEISTDNSGFWYVNLDGEGFSAHEVTDITQYDTGDQSALVWFTVPKATGHSVWLPPYVTENLDEYVLSYNVPIFKGDLFIGVIGIEIDYETMIEPVDNITLYSNGYAFINDDDGTIIYHPRMSMDVLTSDRRPSSPPGITEGETYVRYTYEGVEKQAVWMRLHNGMRLNVSVPIREINAAWVRLILQISGVSVVLLLIFVVITTQFANRITEPLRQLTEAAREVDAGNYDVVLESDTEDEVGILTRTFSRLVGHLKSTIGELNHLAYSDALTTVHNRGAYNNYMRVLQEKIDAGEEPVAFALCMLDCDGLKTINDRYGHNRGDIYLQTSGRTIRESFKNCPIYRLGGDEFAVILMNDEYLRRDELIRGFMHRCAEINARASKSWERISLAMGVAVYDPKNDRSAEDVARRADRLMYQNKAGRKAGRSDALNAPNIQ